MKHKIICVLCLLLACSIALSGCSFGRNDGDDRLHSSELYKTENNYNIDEYMFKEHVLTDYGTVIMDYVYYSTTAQDEKTCNILLPPGYDENKTYPVMYALHGFYGKPSDNIRENSYLRYIYGNMFSENIAKSMIIVSVDMYTDKQADKEDKTQKQLHFIYDKVIEDIVIDLMPVIEREFPVKTGRANTAIAGLSEGGEKALCAYFKYPEKFGYIGAFAPDAGMITGEDYKDTFWNIPYFESLPMPPEDLMPYYMYLVVGTEDQWNIGVTQNYVNVMNEMGIPNQFDYVEGEKHHIAFWGKCFYVFLTKAFY